MSVRQAESQRIVWVTKSAISILPVVGHLVKIKMSAKRNVYPNRNANTKHLLLLLVFSCAQSPAFLLAQVGDKSARTGAPTSRQLPFNGRTYIDRHEGIDALIGLIFAILEPLEEQVTTNRLLARIRPEIDRAMPLDGGVLVLIRRCRTFDPDTGFGVTTAYSASVEASGKDFESVKRKWISDQKAMSHLPTLRQAPPLNCIDLDPTFRWELSKPPTAKPIVPNVSPDLASKLQELREAVAAEEELIRAEEKRLCGRSRELELVKPDALDAIHPASNAITSTESSAAVMSDAHLATLRAEQTARLGELEEAKNDYIRFVATLRDNEKQAQRVNAQFATSGLLLLPEDGETTMREKLAIIKSKEQAYAAAVQRVVQVEYSLGHRVTIFDANSTQIASGRDSSDRLREQVAKDRELLEQDSAAYRNQFADVVLLKRKSAFLRRMYDETRESTAGSNSVVEMNQGGAKTTPAGPFEFKTVADANSSEKTVPIDNPFD